MPLLPPRFRIVAWLACLAMTSLALSHAQSSAKVIILGSGTPIPDPTSSGPCVAVVINGQVYLFDAGANVVRQAEAAAEKFQIGALEATHLTRLFITHLHSDHTLGYPDLILTPWVVGRREPLEVYGPNGIAAMTAHLKQAYAADIQVRTGGLETLNEEGLAVKVHEIEAAGLIYKDENVTVRALEVKHGSWPQAFGYAIDAGGRRIVLSGDTRPTQSIVDACHGCDLLIHEVYSEDRYSVVFGASRGQYHRSFHTSTRELAKIAGEAKPKLLILYHQLYFGDPEQVDLVKEIHLNYQGPVVNGHDLSEY
ncbi:MBL fold metallo-hydrolase [Occallatibacter savannae]|uniref:MBL fold metallo-hydrolase n=1 Tax=Occallatibacter savannae TaxID=1002691 RepID=UPI000D696532|nr:MBL fold metallo-hydrolase [Occallatibacter savannae]